MLLNFFPPAESFDHHNETMLLFTIFPPDFNFVPHIFAITTCRQAAIQLAEPSVRCCDILHVTEVFV